MGIVDVFFTGLRRRQFRPRLRFRRRAC
jgi:hypothetical protein